MGQFSKILLAIDNAHTVPMKREPCQYNEQVLLAIDNAHTVPMRRIPCQYNEHCLIIVSTAIFPCSHMQVVLTEELSDNRGVIIVSENKGSM